VVGDGSDKAWKIKNNNTRHKRREMKRHPVEKYKKSNNINNIQNIQAAAGRGCGKLRIAGSYKR